MLKSTFILILSFLLFQDTYAQKHQIADKDTLLYYFDKHNQLTSIKDSADYFLVIMPADSSSGIKVYPILEYYPNWKRKLMGYSRTQRYNFLTFEGENVEFYRNGYKKSIKQYSNGVLSGNLTLYYPNGKLYADEAYVKDYNLKFINCSDSTGKVLTENGNGKWIKYSDDFTTELEEGMVKDSVEEGTWYTKHANTIDSTIYKKGSAISSSDKMHPLGRISDMIFTAVQQEPSCPEFYIFLQRNMRYPAYAKEHNIQGKVYLQFIVEKDGSISNIKVLRSPEKDLEDEAIRCLTNGPKWHPGMQNGKPVRCMYTVPIGFSLAYDN